jgi:hypothetical protein
MTHHYTVLIGLSLSQKIQIILKKIKNFKVYYNNISYPKQSLFNLLECFYRIRQRLRFTPSITNQQ